MRLKTDISLYDSSRALIAAAGEPLPPLSSDSDGGWTYARWWSRLDRGDDGRWFVARVGSHHRNPLR